jgi:hypothetical protein
MASMPLSVVQAPPGTEKATQPLPRANGPGLNSPTPVPPQVYTFLPINSRSATFSFRSSANTSQTI